jgi:hypothetical protein
MNLCLVILAFAVCASALYSPSSPVVSLDASNFKKEIKSKGCALVEFYAPCKYSVLAYVNLSAPSPSACTCAVQVRAVQLQAGICGGA